MASDKVRRACGGGTLAACCMCTHSLSFFARLHACSDAGRCVRAAARSPLADEACRWCSSSSASSSWCAGSFFSWLLFFTLPAPLSPAGARHHGLRRHLVVSAPRGGPRWYRCSDAPFFSRSASGGDIALMVIGAIVFIVAGVFGFITAAKGRQSRPLGAPAPLHGW